MTALRHRVAIVFVVLAFFAAAVPAAEVASGTLKIGTSSLTIPQSEYSTAPEIPLSVSTQFGGDPTGLTAEGDLAGPGITSPVTVFGAPGASISVPALHDLGDYAVTNIRVVDASNHFVSQASPSTVIIHVIQALGTSVDIKQLTPDEVRARGITLDPRNYDVYQYTYTFTVGNNQTVVVPYEVIIDNRTHQAVTPPAPSPYPFPNPSIAPPPRFNPPATFAITLNDYDDIGDGSGPPPGPDPGPPPQRHHATIPASIVVPTGFGVLHQFFAVMLNVKNLGDATSGITIDSVTATIDPTLAMRVAQTIPAVPVGQPVPVVNPDGSTSILAGMQATGQWSLEALKPGTHTVTITVHATYRAPGQSDTPLKGTVSAAIVVSDPRFHVTFSHPNVVNAGEAYTAYAFVTNLSPSAEEVSLDLSKITQCDTYSQGICRTDAQPVITLDLGPGEMKVAQYNLKSQITGSVYAAAGDATDGSSPTVQLDMGVNAEGIPLSPATLVLPYYTRFVDPTLVNLSLMMFGRGYGIATAPLNPQTARFPRLITTDVFTRAQDVARAGQRMFVRRSDPATPSASSDNEAYYQLALDLLGNVERIDRLAGTAELREWDQFRRMADGGGRQAGAALAHLLEQNGLASQNMTQFATDFYQATSHRSPYALVLAHGAGSGARPFAVSISGTQGTLDVPNVDNAGTSAKWVRDLPYGELDTVHAGSEVGELALVGRWNGDLQITVTPSASSFTIELIYPAADNGSFYRATIPVANATAGVPLTFALQRGNATISIPGQSAFTATAPQRTAIRLLGAAQDLSLDGAGHVVSLSFNRPILVTDAANFRDLFGLTTHIDPIGYVSHRKNDTTTPNAVLQVPGASQQDDGTIANVTFDKALSRNATSYAIDMSSVGDPLSQTPAGPFTVTPRIDNNRPGGMIWGNIIGSDGKVITNTLVKIEADATQYDISSDPAGMFAFEYVARDIDRGISGAYLLNTTTSDGRYTEVKGAVRLIAQPEQVNLVFLGRGTAKGTARYSDGSPIASARVIASSDMAGEFQSTTTAADGTYTLTNLPVGLLTFSATDSAGRVAYASNQIQSSGQVITQDFEIDRLAQSGGTATVKVTVRRSDITDPLASLVPGAHVGVYTRGYGLMDGYSDSTGTITFTNVPAGSVSALAAQFNITRESAAVDFDLSADTIVEKTLTLHVPTATDVYVTVKGTITRDDPSAPTDPTRVAKVGGAIITIGHLPPVTAAADGTYVYPAVPSSYAGSKMSVFDPSTGRRGVFVLGALQIDPTEFSPELISSQAAGVGTLQVRLFDALGAPVIKGRYKVLQPHDPDPILFNEVAPGVFQLPNVNVPAAAGVWAVPVTPGDAVYGDQFTSGSVHVDFDGQTGSTDLRLPGLGSVAVTIRNPQACPAGQTPPCYGTAPGKVNVIYKIWSDADQDLVEVDHIFGPDTMTLANVPALQPLAIETIDNALGYDSQSAQLLYQGDQRNITLTVNSMVSVSGRVLNWDRQTPVAGATVKFEGSAANAGSVPTDGTGTFLFNGIANRQSFRLTASVTINGVTRMGYVDGATNGPVSDLVIVLLKQSAVAGTIVDSNGQAVPGAKYWLRELAWPNLPVGDALSPRFADQYGHFEVDNIFAGPFRIDAESPDVQEVRGVYTGSINDEGDITQMHIQLAIGGAGTGTATFTVIDQLNPNFPPVPNADVTLIRGGSVFDFATTNANGVVSFDKLPPDSNYAVQAFAKLLGRGAYIGGITVTANVETSVRVPLAFSGTVSGKVVDPTGNPVAGAILTLVGGTFQTRATSDIDGTYVFNGIPQGSFRIDVFDVDDGRTASSPTLTLDTTHQTVSGITLTLGPLGSLTVNVYLPNDTGGAGTLSPLVDVTVTQNNYERESQSNPSTFERMLPNEGYSVDVLELTGLQRRMRASGDFSAGPNATMNLVLAATGPATVTVHDSSGNLVQDAQVSVSWPGGGVNGYTNASGVFTALGIPLNVEVDVWVTKGEFAARDAKTITSSQNGVSFSITLASTTTVSGKVYGDNNQLSAGTRVVASISGSCLSQSLTLPTVTDANGAYTFTNVPVCPTTVNLTFYEPDGTTVGDRESASVPSTTPVTVTDARMDGTAPYIVGITPANNANDVSPDSEVVFTFSEQLPAQFVSGSYFTIVSSTNASVAVNVVGSINTDGTFAVHVKPASLLASKTTYRAGVKLGITDFHGNPMASAAGIVFTTVDYTEPSVSGITPAVGTTLPPQVTFDVTYNKQLATDCFAAGGTGTAVLQQISGFGGTVVTTLTTTATVDPANTAIVHVAPTGVAITPGAYYRLTMNGAKDTVSPVPNVQTHAKSFEWIAYDTIKPHIVISKPDATTQLVSTFAFTVIPTITDPSGVASTDIASVDYTEDTTGTAVVHHVVGPNFNLSLNAPQVAQGATATVHVTASATDLSGNTSDNTATAQWTVVPYSGPTQIVVTPTPTSVYPGRSVDAKVTWSDLSNSVTVKLTLTQTVNGTTTNTDVASTSVVKQADGTWPPVDLTFTVPANVSVGAATLTATVSNGTQSGTGSSPLTILADTNPPQVISLTPASGTKIPTPSTYTITLTAKDAETGLAKVVFNVGGAVLPALTPASAGWHYDAASGTYTVSTTVNVKARNADTPVHITADAYDFANNDTPTSSDITYAQTTNVNVPTVAWITPLEGAALPSGQTWPTLLRLRVTGNATSVAVLGDSSIVPGGSVTLSNTTGTTYEASVPLTLPQPGTTFQLIADVQDGVAADEVQLPINIDVVSPDIAPVVSSYEITSSNVSSYTGKTLVVYGPSTTLVIATPVSLRDLIILNKATVTTPEESAGDVTIGNHLFVEADAAIDVASKGYIGGWATRPNSTDTNSSPNGRTVSGQTGALAAASHGGIGGETPLVPTNAVYGSIAVPTELGSGGGGSQQSPGAPGGGAIALRCGTDAGNLAQFAIAGTIRADGGSGSGASRAGSGGSVLITAQQLEAGPSAHITAVGGDENGANGESHGGGGGRIAVTVAKRLDYDNLALLLQARGGRNLAGNGATFTDGGAGTILLRKPGQSAGQLIVSSFDASVTAQSANPTRGTPVSASLFGGSLAFDAISVGPRALARFDDSFTDAESNGPSIDSTSVLLTATDVPTLAVDSSTPASGGNAIQDSNVVVTYDASSAKDGLDSVRATFLGPTDVVDTFGGTHPPSRSASTLSVHVPSDASGSGSLTLRATARSGRTVAAPALSFTIAANAPPQLGTVTVSPATVFAGHSYTATVTATDDVSVTSLTATSAIGTVTTSAPITPGPSVTQTFTVAIPNGVTAQSDTLTISASDGYPGRAATTSTTVVPVQKDTNPPSISFAALPTNNTVLEGAAFTIDANVTDAETGVNTVTMTFNGVTTNMTHVSGTLYRASLTAPAVDGTDPLPYTAQVTATDFAGNPGVLSATINVQPIIDNTAPTITWSCGSPGIMAPADMDVLLKVFIKNPSISNSSTVTITLDTTTTLANAVTPQSDGSVSVTWHTPISALPGETHTVTVTAKALGGNSATYSTVITIVGGNVVATNAQIPANQDTTGSTWVVKPGATLTVIGTHSFKNLVVWGTLVLQDVDVMHPDTVTVDSVYVACSAAIDSSSTAGGHILGFAKNTTYPGAGTPSDASGGGHMGRGGLFPVGNNSTDVTGAVGGTFGSVYRPAEAGGGGEVGDPNYPDPAVGAGGGIVSLVANSVVIDGFVRANGMETASWGMGAGGSVAITTSKLGGGGSVQANAALWSGAYTLNEGGGGGGAVGLQYDSVSGTILNNISALGGISTMGGAAGTVFVKKTTAPYGDLTVNNGTRTVSTAKTITDIPAFGTANVTSVPSAATATIDAPWIGPYLVGNYVRVYAPDTSVRGTWHIVSVANDSSVRTINGVLGVPLQAVAYDGYLMYSDGGYSVNGATAHVVAVRNVSGAWQYDNGAAFASFTPAAGDKLFASFSKNTTTVTSMQTFTCSGPCQPVAGLPTLALVRGEVLMNATPQVTQWVLQYPIAANNSFVLDRDADSHGLTWSGGPATVTLEAGADVRAGDTLRGVYLFDHVTVNNAAVYTPDLLVSTNQPSITSGTLVSGNLGAPSVDPTKMTIAPGANGPVVVGQAGAVTDPDGPIEVYGQNTARTINQPAFKANGAATIGTRGGLSVRKIPNGKACCTSGNEGLATTDAVVTGYAYIQGRPSQTNKLVDLGIGEYFFSINSNGQYGVFVVSGIPLGNIPYDPSMLFRLEKTPTTVTYFVDGKVIYTAACDSTPRAFVARGWDDDGEINSIEYGVGPARFSTVAAADGSFTLPISGSAGDAITVNARDRHVYPLTSTPVAIQTIPASATISAPLLTPSTVIGGHTVTGTVTLGSAAPNGGANVPLSASMANVTIAPATVTIPAGNTTGTFTITTPPVSSNTTVTITASYGGVGYASTLTLTPDTVPPSITITAPATNAQFLEGTGQITVTATVTDADSGVNTVSATLDSVTKPMTANGNSYSTTMTAPFIDGSSPVTKQVTVNATDRAGNPASQSVSITINPVTDPTKPSVTWSCYGAGAILPVNFATKLDVTVPNPSSTNIVQSVVFQFDDGSSLPASLTTNNIYEATWTTPATSRTVTVTAVATAAGGGVTSVPTTINVIAPDRTFTASGSIASGDTSLDGKNVAVIGNTSVVVTIDGQHNFASLTVIGGASVTQTSGVTTPLTIGADTAPANIFIGCGSSIDVSTKGYGANGTYSGATSPSNQDGGSHIGLGGFDSGTLGSTYGSIYRPSEAGAGGGNGGAGGGVLRIHASSLTVEGSIKADGNASGAFNNIGAAGGSLWITTGSIAGSGNIEANGGDTGSWGTGGGGAIAIEYSSTGSGTILSKLSARTGTGSSRGELGGAGSIYLKGPSSTWGDLIVDNAGINGQPTIIPSLGGGVAQPGTTGNLLVTDRSSDIGTYFAGNWIEVSDASGNLKGTWRIATVPAARSVTLAPNTTETITINPGDKWQGVYRFDSVRGNTVVSLDPIHTDSNSPLTLSGSAPNGAFLQLNAGASAGIVTVYNNVKIPSITGSALSVKSGANLATGSTSLNVNASSVTVESGGAIDVSADGYGAGTTYPGEVPPTASTNNGGSHIGVGGIDSGLGGSTYGSIYFPAEAGAGAAIGGMGGGALRIVTSALQVDGSILANGNAYQTFGNYAGAGGSVYITTGSIAGAGLIQANGGDTGSWGTGGGGAIALEYTTTASGTVLSNLSAASGRRSSRSEFGGPGTVYVKGPNAAYGTLTVDNFGVGGQPTILPSLGSGSALAGTAGNLLITDRSAAIQPYFLGNWVEVRDGTGQLRGTWRIGKITSGTQITLTPNNGETISVQPGDKWQGVYRFDTLSLPHGDRITSTDPIRLGDNNGNLTLNGPTSSVLYLNDPINANNVTIASGNVAFSSLTATSLNVQSGAAIELTDLGYGTNTTYPGATQPGGNNGGSHVGIGGIDSGNGGSTYGSICHPAEAGSGGGSGGMGGGAVHINVGSLIVNGSIRANGNAYQTFGNYAGAGGSIWITAGSIDGNGTIEVKGGDTGSWGTGGGGAIAIEYTSVGSGTILSNLTAKEGLRSSRSEFGGPGTIYLKGPGATYGTLLVDNGGTAGRPTQLPSFGAGVAQPGSASNTLVTGASADIPQYFIGNWVEITDSVGTVQGTWRIATIPSPRTVTLAPNSGETINIQPGYGWRGVYRFDAVTIHGATLQSADRIDGTVTADNGGRIIFNASRPLFDQSKVAQITITPTTSGNANIAAPAATVSDPDTPIKLTITNNTTLATFSGNANADGSFTIAVSGNAPDTFTIVATDSHQFPLSSLPITVGGWPSPISIASLTLSSTTVNGAASLAGTVTLTAAPAVPTNVTLSSSVPGTTSMVSTVTIPAGQTSAIATIVTKNPTADTNVTITATLGTSSASANLLVKSVAVSLQLAPASLTGGLSSVATVTLSAATTMPLTTVNIGVSNPIVQPQSNASFNSGMTSTTVTLATTQVTTVTPVVITATYGDVVASATLTVNPPSTAMSVDASKVSFNYNGTLSINAAAGAVSGGVPPLTVSLVDVANPATQLATNVAVDSTGAFTSTMTDARGDHVGVVVRDSTGQSTSVFDVGVALTFGTAGGRLWIANNSGTVVAQFLHGYVNGVFPIALTISDQRTAETQNVSVTFGTDYNLPLTNIHGVPGDAIVFTATDAKGSHATLQVGTVPQPVIIDTSKITVRLGQATGTAGAITGNTGLQAQLNIGTHSYQFVIAGDGSFSLAVSGNEGDAVSIFANDFTTSNATVTLPAYTNISLSVVLINGSTVVGSGSTSFYVRLSSTLATSTTVALSAAPSGVVTFSPNPVTINASQQIGWDTLTYTNPTSDTVVAITASRSGVTAPSNFTVKSVGLSVQPAANTILGGSSSYVNIVPSGGNGATVTLTSSANLSGVPSTLTIGAGSFGRAYFTVANTTVPTTATITATYGAVQSTATINVQPVPPLVIDGTKIGFQPGTPVQLMGSANSVTGGAPQVIVHYIDNTNSSYNQTVYLASNGSFDFDVNSPVGDSISVMAVDAIGNTSAVIAVGNVPAQFSASAASFLIHNDPDGIHVVGMPANPVTGANPISVQVKNTRSGAITNATITSGSPFSIAVPSTLPGDPLTVTVTDAIGAAATDVPIGKVLPSATVTDVAVTSSMADTAFRTRLISIDAATKTLVVASRPDAANAGGSDKIVLFDLTNPVAPAYRSTIATANGPINGIWTANGWIYAVSDTAFMTIDLHATPPAVYVSTDAPTAHNSSVALQGTWALVAGLSTTCCSAEFDVYDVSDPTAAQLFSNTANGGTGSRVTAVLPWRSAMAMVGAPDGNALVSDTEAPIVVYIDQVLWGQQLAGFAAVDDRVFGAGSGSFVEMSFNEWGYEQQSNGCTIPGSGNAVDVAGTTAVVADGTAGLSVVDVSTAFTPLLLQGYGINGNAMNVKIANNVAYVAADSGLKIVSGMGLPPAVDKTVIATTGDGVTAASVTGGSGAVTGQTPITANLTATTSTANGISVASDGSFGPSALVATPGENVTLAAIDNATHQSTRSIGNVPFTLSTDRFTLTQNIADDPNATMRRLAVDGTKLYAADGYPYDNKPESDEIFAFDTTQPVAPQQPAVFHAGQPVQNFVVANGWAYVAGTTDFITVNLTSGTAYTVPGHTSNGPTAVALVGKYAFVGAPTDTTSSAIVLQIYDISNPASPQWVSHYDGSFNRINGLKALGSNRLVVFDLGSGVWILDVTDVANIAVLGSLHNGGTADGIVDTNTNTLYILGDWNGVYAWDISNPASFNFLSFIDSLGPSIGLAVVKPNLIAVATGTAGLTFVDVSDRTNPVIKSTQQTGGSPMDVVVIGKTIYTAGELILDALKLP